MIGSRISAYILILLLVCGVPFLVLFFKSKQFVQGTIWPHTISEFLNGEPTRELDKLYKEAFPIKDFSVTLLNTISYVVFHEARKGAIIGRDGWIYTDEEFVWPSAAASQVEARIDEIFKVEATLSARGTRLAVVLLPQKSTVYREYLGHTQLPLEQEQLYDSVRRKILTHGKIIVPDIRAALIKGKLGQQMFLKTDTHWTVAGAGVSAATVANEIPVNFVGNPQELKSVAAASTAHIGDLLKFVDLGRWSNYLPVREEKIVPVTVMNVASTVDDFLVDPAATKKNTDIVLVGTSYSANPTWSFQSQLELALGTELVSHAEEGKGYASPMRSFLNSSNDDLKNVKLVIWEIPVRYLAVDQAKVK